MEITIIVLAIVALASIGGLIATLICLGQAFGKAGEAQRKIIDQLIANSDHQVRRVEIEQVGRGMDEYNKNVKEWAKNNGSITDFTPPEEGDDMLVRDRGVIP